MTKSKEENRKDENAVHRCAEGKELAFGSCAGGSEKVVEISGEQESKPVVSKSSSDKSLVKAESLPANISLGEDIAKKLIEIEKKDQLFAEQDHIKEEKKVVVSEIAKRIVEALTSNQVLGKVLMPEEATILRDYFSRKIPLSEKVLATLDTALDKILRRAHEFYDDKRELYVFLKDRDSAKTKLLDALIAKKSNYLVDLMTDASFYADRISKGLIDAYKLATEGILVARDNLHYMQAAVGHTYRYSKEMAYRGAALTYETATRGKELAEIGASISAQMTSDAAKMTINAAVRGKELAERGAAIGTKMTSDAAKITLDAAVQLAERGAAIGTKMTSDAAKITLDAAVRGKELAERGAAIGTKMTYDVTNRGKEIAELGVEIGAKVTQDAAFKGLQIAEGTIQAASKGIVLHFFTSKIQTSITVSFKNFWTCKYINKARTDVKLRNGNGERQFDSSEHCYSRPLGSRS
ncbi:hypothetical protein LOAG_18441 [Loa loa]|uniref:DUF7774 domain-containing protein n=1 Tax=Loa loa TaxID=7209 RepID=A0A1S0UF47_LOALO|nr:hypothetical protein LOAG_18441 [Loa loa]EJD74209.1 hypothetical protein LOAG_18441 [Loa loa]